jgi:hypothetical protein
VTSKLDNSAAILVLIYKKGNVFRKLDYTCIPLREWFTDFEVATVGGGGSTETLTFVFGQKRRNDPPFVLTYANT